MARHFGALTIDKLVQMGAIVGVTPGHALIERFCAAISAGTVPDSEDLKLLADAFQPLRYSGQKNSDDDARRKDLDQFSKRIGLTKKQGRQQGGFGEIEKLAWPVVLFKLRWAELIAAGEKKKQAEIQARNEAASFAGIGDRQMRDRIHQHSETADLLIHALGDKAIRKILEDKSGE